MKLLLAVSLALAGFLAGRLSQTDHKVKVCLFRSDGTYGCAVARLDIPNAIDNRVVDFPGEPDGIPGLFARQGLTSGDTVSVSTDLVK